MGNVLYYASIPYVFYDQWHLTDTFKLNPMRAHPNMTTVSGFSGGGGMATALHVIHS